MDGLPTRRIALARTLALAVLGALAACASRKAPDSGPSPDAPAHPQEGAGLSPARALSAMQLAPGFQVDLVAAEPDLHQPIALAVDDRGRVWVAEAFQYPQRAEGDTGRDDVLVFEDRDGDGKHETRTVFVSGLNLVSGLEVGFGGVWIGAAPHLLFVPDADGDLVPDGPPRVELDGWSFEDTHETLNTFAWGPDGWLYGCQGVFAHSMVGRPGTPDEERTPMNGGVWRFDPRSARFEVFAWGTSNPWGVDFDARGQCVTCACVLPHLWHMVQGGRYERQVGSHFDPFAYDEITTIADHRHYVGADLQAIGPLSSEAGGGHAHCGALVALGDAFPPEWRGSVLMGNLHGNRVLADRLEPAGSGLVGRHAGNWLLANDPWFRPIALREGAGGAVYLIDWYDRQACHLTEDDPWDRTNGRLYRITSGARPAGRVDLAAQPSRALAALLASENEWTARHALRLLHERGPDPALAEELARTVSAGATETLRLRALWALRAAGGLDDARGRRLLAARDESVVAWTVQLLLEDRSVEPETLAELVRLARERASALVRLYLASALQRLPVAERWELAQALLARAEDARDHNIPCVLWYGVEPLVAADPERALGLAWTSGIERIARFLVRRAASDPALQPALVSAIAAPENETRRAWMLEEFLKGVGTRRNLSAPAGWNELRAALDQDPAAEVRDRAARLAAVFGDPTSFQEQRRLLADPEADAGDRRAALDALARGHDPELCGALRGLLDDRALRTDVLRALAECEDGGIAGDVLLRWSTFDDSERREALGLLSSRRNWAVRLVYAIGSGQIARSEVDAFVVLKVESLGDDRLAARMHEVWGRVRATPEARRKHIDELKAALTPAVLSQADLPRGREVFARACQQCHTLFGSGGRLAPELTGANRADLEYLLMNVVDPSAVVAKDYWTTLVTLEDGRLLAGIQIASTETSITVRSESGDVLVERSEIEESRVQEVSLMPEGLLDALPPEQVRDLIAYLQSPRQTALLATEASAASFFDGESLRLWHGGATWSVEGGEIVGRTKGLEHSDHLCSEIEVRDFRLSFEARLEGGAGNAGVLFRARELAAGGMAGYHLGIGTSTWGRLSDEGGRGVLSDASGAEPVAADDWIPCEIEARRGHVRAWINGRPVADIEDPRGAQSGIVGLKLGAGGPTHVRFRNLKLAVLGPAEKPR